MLKILYLKESLYDTLKNIINARSSSQSEIYRAKILLFFHNKSNSYIKAARELGKDEKTIALWFSRGIIINEKWESHLKNKLSELGHSGEGLRKIRLLKDLLSDNPRLGAPVTYSIEIYTQIVELALKDPEDLNYPISHWTARELYLEIHKQEISTTISQRQVKRFLDDADLKPHKIEYWLNPKIDDEGKFRENVKEICELYLSTPTLAKEGIRVISTDEKTSIQALERIAPTKKMKPGVPEKKEAEYKRHGALCLMPSFDIAKGSIIETSIGETRNEEDFANHIKNTIKHDLTGKWIIVCDNLNTHLSASLVKLIASLINYNEDLGIKRKRGILENQASRKKFLQDKSHNIRFVYTPKHCSWLNQVEIWFGILERKLLKRGEFTSKENLKEKLLKFITYFNKTMAKPFKWTYKGIPLKA